MDGDSCNLNTVSHYAIPLASIAFIELRYYAGVEAVHDNRLSQEVVGSKVVTFHYVFVRIERGNDDDRQLLSLFFSSQLLYHVVTVYPRHHKVEQYEVWFVVCHDVKRCLSVIRFLDYEVEWLEHFLNQSDVDRNVIYYQDRCLAGINIWI